MRISATNRGRSAAPLHVVPQLWFRNDWSWSPGIAKPALEPLDGAERTFRAGHRDLGEYRFAYAGDPRIFVTDNETNFEAVFGAANPQPYVKDGIDRAIVRDDLSAVNPEHRGTKLALDYAFVLEPGEMRQIRMRLTSADSVLEAIDEAFDTTFKERQFEADRFYAALNPSRLGRPASRAALGLRRHALEQTILPIRGPRLAEGRSVDAPAAGRTAPSAETTTGTISSTTT